jgi:hypothetical protein
LFDAASLSLVLTRSRTVYVQRFIYHAGTARRRELESALREYADTLNGGGLRCSLALRILTGEAQFSLSFSHDDINALETVDLKIADDAEFQSYTDRIGAATASVMQDVWEVLVPPQPGLNAKYAQMVRHTPAPAKVGELRQLLIERAGLIAASPGVLGSAVYEQFLPPHGLTAFATISLFDGLAGMEADHAALPANPAFIENALKASAASAAAIERHVFRVLVPFPS